MKEASGELNMTVITIIAIGAIAAFFVGIFNGVIKNTVNREWDGAVDKAHE